MNQIINIIIRQFTNHGVRWGVRKGADAMAKRKAGLNDDPKAQRVQDRKARETAKKANRMIRMMRRLMRF